MNRWIDTHCHLGDPAFESDRDEVVTRMVAAGVGDAIVVESDLSRLEATRGWLAQYSQLRLATGCHPHDASSWDAGGREAVLSAWDAGVIAAGEMGLDYHYDNSPRSVQRRVFGEQLALAVERDLPIIIHAREADADVVAVLKDQPRARVVLHSFSGGPGLRDAGLEHGWWFSFSGMVTFRSWLDEETVRLVSTDRLLLETDAPYLAPVPHRGGRNEPAFVVEVGRRCAEVRGAGFAELAAATSRNAAALFGLD